MTLERLYTPGELTRIGDLLADTRGEVRVKFTFHPLESGGAGASIALTAELNLVCQRCMQGWTFALAGESEVEFAGGDVQTSGATREIVVMRGGQVSLRELAEEELLLTLPIVALCSTPQTCGQAPQLVPAGDDAGPGALGGEAGRMSAAEADSNVSTRPFAGLQDLLKKT